MTSFLLLISAYNTNILTNRKADRLTVAVKYHIQLTVMRISWRSTIVDGRQHKHIYKRKLEAYRRRWLAIKSLKETRAAKK